MTCVVVLKVTGEMLAKKIYHFSIGQRITKSAQKSSLLKCSGMGRAA